MPPKIKTTREAIVNAALELVRTSGSQSINARNVAAALNCSTQPVFSNFATMEQLHIAVTQRAMALYDEYIRSEIVRGEYPAYKASGMAYIRFAKEERELFKLLYMCDRGGAPLPEGTSVDSQMESLVRQNIGLDDKGAKLFHLEMWAYVHGIATMFATGYLNLDWELVSQMLSDAYLGIRKQYTTE